MKEIYYILILLLVFLHVNNLYTQEYKFEKIQKKSELVDFENNYPGTSYPGPFLNIVDYADNPKNSPAISTGYYFISSNSNVSDSLKPTVTIIDTTEDEDNWYRILSGPNQKDEAYWNSHKDEGRRYFRNPNNMNDSTDNAIAGPIPIGFKFVFNGIEYDSFYVSTNGAILFSNPRYLYNSNGDRTVVENNYGSSNCYNTMSMDWFDRGMRNRNGLNDNTPDDFGWQKAVQYGCSQIHAVNSRPDNNGGGMNIPIIAPFWGDGSLVQWSTEANYFEDRGRAYFYRDPDADRIIIYFVNWQLKDTIKYPGGEYYLSDAGSVGEWDNVHVSANAQIVLDARDSTIQINYENFTGRIQTDRRTWDAKELIRFNTSCAVSGLARHIDYDSKEALQDTTYTGRLPWDEEYDQSTYAWSKYLTKEHTSYPEDFYALKFKQWKNTFRVCDIQYRVRKQEEDSPNYTEEILSSDAIDYEILAGHEQIGQLQPVIIIQNLTNDIQGPDGVNFQQQDMSLRVRCAIINQATRRPLYNRYISIDSANIAKKETGEAAYEKLYLVKVSYDGKDYIIDTTDDDYYDENGEIKGLKGIPPYGYAAVFTAPFEPNDLFMSHIGLMKIYAMLDPTNHTTGESYGDEWTFDDTLSKRFWTMRHIPNDEPFIDNGTEYHVITDDNGEPKAIPSVFKWVSKGAVMVDGEEISEHPLPPRDKYYCENNEVFENFRIKAPTFKLCRPESVPIGEWGGDEMISFPIDMYHKMGTVLTIAVQRTRKMPSWDRAWSDEKLIGCEHRVVNSHWYDVVQEPDELLVQFAKPTTHWRAGIDITNIPDSNWTYHPRRGGAEPERNMSAFTIFGGGGHMVGFLETDRDSALAPPVYTPASERKVNGLRYDFYDDGIDKSFKKYFIPIPDTFINMQNEGAKYFRFRIKVNSKNNQLTKNTIPDDNDEWFVDDVWTLYATCECCDIAMTKVSAKWNYTKVPATQAVAVPIRLQLSNNTDRQAPSFWVQTRIMPKLIFDNLFFIDSVWVWEGDPEDDDYDEMIELNRGKNQKSRDSARFVLLQNHSVYCQVKQLPFLRPGADEPIVMPDWNARMSPPGEYVILSHIYVPGGDAEPENDTSWTAVNINYGPTMNYNPMDSADFRNATNDVEEMFDEEGLGLSIYGYSMGGIGNNWSGNYEIGETFGDGCSGQIAVKFTLVQEDTLFGYGAYFPETESLGDHTVYNIYTGTTVPNELVPNSTLYTKIGMDDIKDTTLINQFSYALLEKPLVLPAGDYWISLAQIAEERLNIGASKTNTGMRTTNVYFHNPQNPVQNGSMGIFLNIDKTMRKREKFGSLININLAAYENGFGSGAWEEFAPTIGNPGYPHLPHEGYSPVDDETKTYSRGSWIPLIVPYFGDRSYSTEYQYEDCIPVELTFFEGKVRNGKNNLYWETASETNNYGFFVERRIDDENSNWLTYSELIPGYGTSKIPREYNYKDGNVIPNTTYQYRLRQIDIDGTQTPDDFTDVVTLTYTEQGVISLEPNTPNPFTDRTNISFSIPEQSKVRVDIYDLFGNKIKNLYEGELNSGRYSYYWNGENENKIESPQGTYIMKLTVNEKVFSQKIVYVGK